MEDVIRRQIERFSKERDALMTSARHAEDALSSGNFNAFLELAFRKTRDDAQTKMIVLSIRIETLEGLLKENRDGKLCTDHR